MSFRQSEMLYNDGYYYRWPANTAASASVNEVEATYTVFPRTDGVAILQFINRLGEKYWAEGPPVTAYQKMERMIRYDVPESLTTPTSVERWIITYWSAY